MREQAIEALLSEDRTFEPAAEFRAEANASDPSIHERAAADPEAFWASFAEELDWFEPWQKVLEWQAPHAQWFVGGKLNVAYNCLDRHLDGARRNKAALIWEGEPGESRPGERRVYTYWDLYRAVSRFANVLKSLGVKKGDRVGIYLPMVPEAAIAMLACARIGAPRRGKPVELKAQADKALEDAPSVETCIVVKRGGGIEVPIHMREGRDRWYHELMQEADAHCDAEPMDAEDMLYILYTSGTTGKPKGVVHTTGGYLTHVYATTKLVFDLKESDV
jgi:acetyl-CoA synthetase